MDRYDTEGEKKLTKLLGKLQNSFRKKLGWLGTSLAQVDVLARLLESEAFSQLAEEEGNKRLAELEEYVYRLLAEADKEDDDMAEVFKSFIPDLIRQIVFGSEATAMDRLISASSIHGQEVPNVRNADNKPWMSRAEAKVNFDKVKEWDLLKRKREDHSDLGGESRATSRIRSHAADA